MLPYSMSARTPITQLLVAHELRRSEAYAQPLVARILWSLDGRIAAVGQGAVTVGVVADLDDLGVAHGEDLVERSRRCGSGALRAAADCEADHHRVAVDLLKRGPDPGPEAPACSLRAVQLR